MFQSDSLIQTPLTQRAGSRDWLVISLGGMSSLGTVTEKLWPNEWQALCDPPGHSPAFNTMWKVVKLTKRLLSLGSQVFSGHQPLDPCHPALEFCPVSPNLSLADCPPYFQPFSWKIHTARMGGTMQVTEVPWRSGSTPQYLQGCILPSKGWCLQPHCHHC